MTASRQGLAFASECSSSVTHIILLTTRGLHGPTQSRQVMTACLPRDTCAQRADYQCGVVFVPLAGWPGEATEMFCVCKDPPGEEQERAKWKGRGHPRKAGQAWVRKPLVCEVRLLGAPQTSMTLGYGPKVVEGYLCLGPLGHRWMLHGG